MIEEDRIDERKKKEIKDRKTQDKGREMRHKIEIAFSLQERKQDLII